MAAMPLVRSIANSPTLTNAGTVEGVILGTAVDPSPEQARGRAVDKRADIWAFGCVLFETLTGLRVFGRETVSDSITAILGQEPDWKALPADLPNRIEHLLRRCLTKDPRGGCTISPTRASRSKTASRPHRRHAGDTAGTGGSCVTTRCARMAAVGARWRSRRWRCVVASTFALKRNGGTGVTEGDAGEVHDVPPGVVTFTPAGNFVAFSPDGKYLAFAAANDAGLPTIVAPGERRARGPRDRRHRGGPISFLVA